MAKSKPSVSKIGNTTTMKYKGGTVVKISVTKPYNYSKLSDDCLADLAGRRRRRKKKRRSKKITVETPLMAFLQVFS